MGIKLAIKVAYFNTLENMHGFQIQPNVETIQQCLIKAITKIQLIDVNNFKLEYAGRTDNGVNALCQVLSFFLADAITQIPERLLFQINKYLPKNIRCWAYSAVPNDFNPRYYAVERTYWYIWYESNIENFYFEEVEKSKNLLIGRKNFLNFSKKDKDVNDTIREISSITIKRNKNTIIFIITGQSFLWQQCRRIVSHLVQIGNSEINIDETKRLLSDLENTKKPFPLPAENLILTDIKYSDINFISENAIIKKIMQQITSKINIKRNQISLLTQYLDLLTKCLQ